jgi:hypothetical protein
MHSIGEIVKQFQFDVPLLSYPIKEKIVKDISTNGGIRYTWSISHRYTPTAGAGVYFPSVLTSDSLEEAEMNFRAYAESFVPDYEVRANDYF